MFLKLHTPLLVGWLHDTLFFLPTNMVICGYFNLQQFWFKNFMIPFEVLRGRLKRLPALKFLALRKILNKNLLNTLM